MLFILLKAFLGKLYQFAIQPADYVQKKKKKLLVAFNVLTLFCKFASLKIISHFVLICII